MIFDYEIACLRFCFPRLEAKASSWQHGLADDYRVICIFERRQLNPIFISNMQLPYSYKNPTLRSPSHPFR